MIKNLTETYKQNTCTHVGFGVKADGGFEYHCHYGDKNVCLPCHCRNCGRYEENAEYAEEYDNLIS